MKILEYCVNIGIRISTNRCMYFSYLFYFKERLGFYIPILYHGGSCLDLDLVFGQISKFLQDSENFIFGTRGKLTGRRPIR